MAIRFSGKLDTIGAAPLFSLQHEVTSGYGPPHHARRAYAARYAKFGGPSFFVARNPG